MSKQHQPLIVRGIENAKKRFGLRTYHFELTFTLLFLTCVAVLSNKGLVEWIGVLAVYFTFAHATVGDRLAEVQAKEHKEQGKATIECYHKLSTYFYLKEICWFGYFVILGAWSAIAGVFLFLLYPLWRKWWRKYQPV